MKRTFSFYKDPGTKGTEEEVNDETSKGAGENEGGGDGGGNEGEE